MGDWQNRCGGKRWRTDPEGFVEVEGDGYPEYAPGTTQFGYLENTWNNWAPQFRSAAREYGIPVSWILAIATIETGPWAKDKETQRTIVSGDGFGSIGITQPLASFAKQMGFHPDDRYDPLQNIRMAAKWASQNAQKYGPDLPSVAASHNAGSLRCSAGRNQFGVLVTGDYVGAAIRYNNSALRYLKLDAFSWAPIAAVAVVAGAGVAAYIMLR